MCTQPHAHTAAWPSVYEMSCVVGAETISFGVSWWLPRGGLCGRSHSCYCWNSWKNWVLPSLAIGFHQSDFKREMPYWLLKILTACLIACDLSTERGRTGCLMTLLNDGYFPSLYPLPMILLSGPSSQDQLIWWAHIFGSCYFCYTGDRLVIWQEHSDLQRHVSKWLVWIFMTADKV